MKPKVTTVQETPYGIYVWVMPNGAVIADSDGPDRNYLCINARQGDLKAMAAITREVRSYGITEGEPFFIPEVHKVDDEEYYRQKERLEQGLIPDPLDIGAWREEERLHGKK